VYEYFCSRSVLFNKVPVRFIIAMFVTILAFYFSTLLLILLLTIQPSNDNN
jgi:ABC-type multidrug transport system permease subunit